MVGGGGGGRAAGEGAMDWTSGFKRCMTCCVLVVGSVELFRNGQRSVAQLA